MQPVMMSSGLLLMAVCCVLSGCVDDSKSPGEKEEHNAGPTAAGGFPGYGPPPVAELVAQAVDKAAPQENAERYSPKKVKGPSIVPDHPELLPRTDDGRPLLVRITAATLTVDEDLSDPITAAASCMQLVTGCIEPPSVEEERTRDSCMASARSCETNHPWTEQEACCPQSCKDVYRELRERDYSMKEAWILTRTGDCFPSLREFMAAAREASQVEDN